MKNFSANFQKLAAEIRNLPVKFWKIAATFDTSFSPADFCEILERFAKFERAFLKEGSKTSFETSGSCALVSWFTGFPGSSRVSALAPYSSGDRVGSTLSTPHAGGDVGLFVGECSSPQTDAPKQRRGMSHQRPDLSSHSSCADPRPNFQIGREARALRSDVVVVATYFYLALRGELLPVV